MPITIPRTTRTELNPENPTSPTLVTTASIRITAGSTVRMLWRKPNLLRDPFLKLQSAFQSLSSDEDINGNYFGYGFMLPASAFPIRSIAPRWTERLLRYSFVSS
jgi:hypothetical protein